MKRIVLTTGLVTAVAAGAGYAAFPDEVRGWVEQARPMILAGIDRLAANPISVVAAVGTFALTVVYHKLKGKSLRESVEVAATRVTVVTAAPVAGENPVVTRAKARATRTQLLTDQIVLQNRLRSLPADVTKAEKEACYSEQAVADAEKALAAKQAAHDALVGRLDALRAERAAGAAELAAIDAELKKLADVV